MIVQAQPQQRNALSTLGAIIADYAAETKAKADEKFLRDEQYNRALAAEQRARDYEATIYGRNRTDRINDEKAINDRELDEAIDAENRRLESSAALAKRERAIAEFEAAKNSVLASKYVSAADKKRLVNLTFDKAMPEDFDAIRSMAEQAILVADAKALEDEGLNRAARLRAMEASDAAEEALAAVNAERADAAATLGMKQPSSRDVEDELKALGVDPLSADPEIKAQASRNAWSRLEAMKEQALKTLSLADEKERSIITAARQGIRIKMPGSLMPNAPANPPPRAGSIFDGEAPPPAPALAPRSAIALPPPSLRLPAAPTASTPAPAAVPASLAPSVARPPVDLPYPDYGSPFGDEARALMEAHPERFENIFDRALATGAAGIQDGFYNLFVRGKRAPERWGR